MFIVLNCLGNNCLLLDSFERYSDIFIVIYRHIVFRWNLILHLFDFVFQLFCWYLKRVPCWSMIVYCFVLFLKQFSFNWAFYNLVHLMLIFFYNTFRSYLNCTRLILQFIFGNCWSQTGYYFDLFKQQLSIYWTFSAIVIHCSTIIVCA